MKPESQINLNKEKLLKDYTELSLADFFDIPGKDIYERAGDFSEYAKETKKRRNSSLINGQKKSIWIE